MTGQIECNWVVTSNANSWSPSVRLTGQVVRNFPICHPNHTQNGKVHYKFSDAAFAHGMSVTRKVHRPDWKSSVEHLCRSKVCNREGKREYHALGSFQAGNVREVLYEDQTRAFYIYDTAAANNAAHADVFSFRYPGNSDALTEDARTDRMTAQMQLVLGVTES